MGFITDRAPPSPLALHRQHTHINNASDENSPPPHRKPPPRVQSPPNDHEDPREHLNNNNHTTTTTAAAAVGEEITITKGEEETKVTFFPTPHNTNPPPMNRTFPSSSASPWNPSPPAIKSGGGSQTFSLTTVPSFSSWVVEGVPLQPLEPQQQQEQQQQQQQQQQFYQPLGPPRVSDVIANITGTTPVQHGNGDDAPMSPLDKLIVEIDCEEGFPATAIDFDDEHDELQQREQEQAVGMEGLVMGVGEHQQHQQQSQRGMTTRSAARRQIQD
jgi:hypothetical protein